MNFQASFLLKNPHIQTIYASLFRKDMHLEFEKERFSLSDGDFVDAYWYKVKEHTASTPIAILFHGLAGSYKSPYIQGVVKSLNQEGISAVLMHFRGCSGEDNCMARSYHSGDTTDAKEFIYSVAKHYPHAMLFGVGYSLGANMLLKLLAEEKKNIPLKAAVAVSAPMLLDVCADKMNRGFSRFYQKRLLNDLRIALNKKYEKHDMEKLLDLKKEDIPKLTNFWEFDEAYTSKINGFKSAQDYYTKSSSKQYLKDIQCETLIIHSKDDPFMTPEVIPNKDEVSKSVTLEILEHGGHVGFVSGSIFKPEYWLEKRITNFIKEKIQTKT